MNGLRTQIRSLLKTHYDEIVVGGIVDKSPSRLTRGEGVQRNFFILKIDLVGSTLQLKSSRSSTYLKLAHTYLSSIDQISKNWGADTAQTEYAGDGLLTYFDERESSAERVLSAACCMKVAVDELSSLDATLGNLRPRCRMVLHFAPLTVAKIGPRNESFLTAIGYPIHVVAKLEQNVPADVGRVTKEFFSKVPSAYRRHLIEATFEESQALVTAPQQIPTRSNALADLLCPPKIQTPQNTLAQGLRQFGLSYGSSSAPSAYISPYSPPALRTKPTVTGYNVSWESLWHQIA